MAELAEKGDVFSMEDVNARGAAVNALISKKSYNEALVKSLETPPLGSKSQEIKDANRDTVFKVIEVIPDKDIGPAVDAVEAAGPAALDILLKYVYLALATPRPPLAPGLEGAAAEAGLLEQKKWSGSLLKWHPLVAAKTGPGGVVRVMTDRKTV